MKEHPIIFSATMVRAIIDSRKPQTRRVVMPRNSLVNDFRRPNRLIGFDFDPARFEPKLTPGGNSYLRASPANDDPIQRIYPAWRRGDLLWVREKWRIGRWWEEDGEFALDYCDGPDRTRHGIPDDWDGEKFQKLWKECCGELDSKGVEVGEDRCYHWNPGESPLRWRSPVTMPRWASRITLEVTGMRVERVQDISEQDAISEGMLMSMFRGDWAKQHFPEYYAVLEATPDGQKPPLGPSPAARFSKYWDDLNAKRGHGWATNPWVWVIEFERVEADQFAGAGKVIGETA